MTRPESQQQPDDVVLSVVVAVVSDTTDRTYALSHLAGCLTALRQQVEPPPMEIIVPYPADEPAFQRVAERFPDVRFIPVTELQTHPAGESTREHHDELRAHGLAAARGEIVGLLEDHARPDRGWCWRVVKEHRRTDAVAVGGAIENGIDRALNWAVYFCDFGKYQNPVPAGETTYASDANISYKRAALTEIESVWRDAFHETEVNWTLRSRGARLVLSPDVVVYQHRSNLRFFDALKERFVWGRSYAATRSRHLSTVKRGMYAALSPVLPGVLLTRMAANVLRKGRNRRVFFKVFPLTTLLTFCWSLGELSGYLTMETNGSLLRRREGVGSV